MGACRTLRAGATFRLLFYWEWYPVLAIIEAAGWPVWPLILASVVAVAIIIERAYSLRTQEVRLPVCCWKRSRSIRNAA